MRPKTRPLSGPLAAQKQETGTCATLSDTCISSRGNRPGTRPIPQILVRTFAPEKKIGATKRD